MELINKRELLAEMDDLCGGGCTECCGVLEDVKKRIEAAPAVLSIGEDTEAADVHGKDFKHYAPTMSRRGEWVRVTIPPYHKIHGMQCSLCGMVWILNFESEDYFKHRAETMNFCSNCGAAMKRS